ncbi:hypothetical protein [Mediterraneibacter gnavus]|nr:hypothetical protein [Mediterraneibacter gnavus]
MSRTETNLFGRINQRKELGKAFEERKKHRIGKEKEWEKLA